MPSFRRLFGAYYRGYYKDVVTTVPEVRNGEIYPLTAPGLGTDLLPDLPDRPDATVQITSA